MSNMEVATFGGGCFWCVEAVMQRLKGVERIESGYTGGTAPGKPTYREVCSGLTGHAEVVQVTTLNRQGADRGTQYRSVIYYHSDIQKSVAEEVLVEAASSYDDPIVTELSELGVYYSAEDHHQNYYNNNGSDGYCSAVITPKVNKLRAKYADLLKEGA
jgi:peptide-methionine (S)-S-oxide reductase